MASRNCSTWSRNGAQLSTAAVMDHRDRGGSYGCCCFGIWGPPVSPGLFGFQAVLVQPCSSLWPKAHVLSDPRIPSTTIMPKQSRQDAHCPHTEIWLMDRTVSASRNRHNRKTVGYPLILTEVYRGLKCHGPTGAKQFCHAVSECGAWHPRPTSTAAPAVPAAGTVLSASACLWQRTP